MNSRQSKILEILKKSDRPVSASALADRFGVSRQSIVGDIALLRAGGEQITATARGYLLEGSERGFWPYVGTAACRHTSEQLTDELYTVVDLGGTVIDVSIDHPIYGELTGRLDISSRYDADVFLQRVAEEDGALPISTLTGGFHLHRIGCRDRATFERILSALAEKGIAKVS
ncbi:MAG: transcription repressor NadR [Lachnospiraceae bacterium]|nr:transcription repressor NadR [Lachnospiraceae bacterium]MBQ1399268.1 transcription repressor NadR [Lachnospiraceae bacterium]MBQ1414526.1 transcription repressor NadR [Lachnospiraceae bacterium]